MYRNTFDASLGSFTGYKYHSLCKMQISQGAIGRVLEIFTLHCSQAVALKSLTNTMWNGLLLWWTSMKRQCLGTSRSGPMAALGSTSANIGCCSTLFCPRRGFFWHCFEPTPLGALSKANLDSRSFVLWSVVCHVASKYPAFRLLQQNVDTVHLSQQKWDNCCMAISLSCSRQWKPCHFP